MSGVSECLRKWQNACVRRIRQACRQIRMPRVSKSREHLFHRGDNHHLAALSRFRNVRRLRGERVSASVGSKPHRCRFADRWRIAPGG